MPKQIRSSSNIVDSDLGRTLRCDERDRALTYDTLVVIRPARPECFVAHSSQAYPDCIHRAELVGDLLLSLRREDKRRTRVEAGSEGRADSTHAVDGCGFVFDGEGE